MEGNLLYKYAYKTPNYSSPVFQEMVFSPARPCIQCSWYPPAACMSFLVYTEFKITLIIPVAMYPDYLSFNVFNPLENIFISSLILSIFFVLKKYNFSQQNK